jgi:kumamolisin
VSFTSNCVATALNFWLHIDTAETTNTTAFDKMTVKVNGAVEATLSNLNHTNGYTFVSIPLGGISGSVSVSFTATEDESLQTSFVIDDVALALS